MRCLVSGVERPVYTLGGGGDVSLREACLFAILLKTVPLKVYMTQKFFLLYFAVLYTQKPILNLKLA